MVPNYILLYYRYESHLMAKHEISKTLPTKLFSYISNLAGSYVEDVSWEQFFENRNSLTTPNDDDGHTNKKHINKKHTWCESPCMYTYIKVCNDRIIKLRNVRQLFSLDQSMYGIVEKEKLLNS